MITKLKLDKDRKALLDLKKATRERLAQKGKHDEASVAAAAAAAAAARAAPPAAQQMDLQ